MSIRIFTYVRLCIFIITLVKRNDVLSVLT